MSKRAFKFRFYPTQEQEALLRRTVGSTRFVYNRALALRNEAWAQNKERLSGFDLIKKITIWKKEEGTEWLSKVSNVPLQQSISNLDAAFQNFFAKRSKYPSFKKKTSGGSARFTTSGFRIKRGNVWLAKTKTPLNIVWSRHLPEGCPPSQCTVKLTPSGEWFISFLCEVEIAKLPPINKHLGIDLGITSLIATSDGEHITNPKPYRLHKRKLAHAQRNLARKVKGSCNSRKSKRKVARIHLKISDTRKDHLHKLSTRLVRENQSIAIEDLAVRNMLNNHCLAGSISDSGWAMFKSMLEYKCAWYGRELRVVDRWFPSSKTCSGCGHVKEKMPLNVRDWTCPKCSAVHNRDVNAAKNILAAGIVVNACGGAVNPNRRKSRTLASVKQEHSPFTEMEFKPLAHAKSLASQKVLMD